MYVQFKLRVRQGLLAKLRKAAKKNGHSANAEAVARLEQSFSLTGRRARDRDIVDEIFSRFDGVE